MLATTSAVAEPKIGQAVGTTHRQQVEERLLTKAELAERLGLPNPRAVEVLVQKKRLPVIVLGYRTKKFSWPAVLKALEKLTVKEAGAQ